MKQEVNVSLTGGYQNTAQTADPASFQKNLCRADSVLASFCSCEDADLQLKS